MFGRRRRRSSTIRVMQLFHELKQQFPTVPDHVVNACIASYTHSNSPHKDATIRELLEAAAQNQEPMGRSPPTSQPSPTPSQHPPPATSERTEMNASAGDINQNVVKYVKKHESVSVCPESKSQFFVKRPDTLELQPSGKCKDVHKLLNSEHVSDNKPPRSPKRGTRRTPEAKRLQDEGKKETASTPTQTTDTLLGGNSVNLSLNVNVDVLPSPTRRKSVLQVTPQQPWLEEPLSPRSYTSVNLTLRPPSSEPQAPIDITSQNSSLTYSTRSYDSQKGLQSRLQITVGPGGGSVSSTRARPRSSYHPEQAVEEVVPYRAGSLTNLAASSEPPVILKQQARIDRLKIELRTEKAKLEVMQKEVIDLEGRNRPLAIQPTDAEVEKQLRREIKHLQYQCEQLALEVDKNSDLQEDFYHNIYTGQRGPLNVEGRRFTQPNAFQDNEGPKWNCHLCTFLNHPDLDKCEQCEMPRILHVSAAPGDNIHIHVTPRLSRRVVHSWVL
ncbi:TAK1-associated binding protein 2 isoform B [Tribolium castaneum]|uniref:Tab2 n=1 Tax=Tribolium castaneum TaxID=7070 RepID=A0A139WDZ1_TRICA|nr:TAK1-associated binding protein 2 isoform B [Tribolium castaneum]KYB26139.1 Tab2 [Tribolium castaneum]|eukprot:NP_001164317.1 TAK1-associated binding protein 2 isoform B [Tribolium castaneum]